jgi:hypothetical protein
VVLGVLPIPVPAMTVSSPPEEPSNYHEHNEENDPAGWTKPEPTSARVIHIGHIDAPFYGPDYIPRCEK